MVVTDIAQLRSMLDAKAPIEGVTFGDVDWSDLDCERATFIDCTIERAQFSNVVFAAAKFSRCQFPRCRFARSELCDAEFDECGFTTRDDKPIGCSFAFGDL